MCFWALLLCLNVNLSYAESDACPPAAMRPDPATIEAAAQVAKDHGFLWRVAKGEQVSYLYGTIHIARFEEVSPGPLTKDALIKADMIALELDMGDPSIMQQLLKSMMETKSHAIPDALIERVKRAAKGQCFPYEHVAIMMPEMQVASLGILDSRRDALYTDYGIDSMLSGFGHAAKKNVISLEAPKMQMEMLRMSSQAETVELVDKSLSMLESGETRTLTKRMYEQWVASNYAFFERYEDWCQCMDTDSDKKYMKRLLDDRNIKMAEKIDQLHTSGQSVFAAVGSLHMFGESGLPKLMRQRGYQVEVVRFKK